SLFELWQNEKHAESLAVLHLGDLAASHREALEHGGVVELVGAAVGFPVGLASVLDELEGNSQDFLPFGQSGLDAVESLLDLANIHTISCCSLRSRLALMAPA